MSVQPPAAPPGYYMQPPPKKKHTVRNVFLVLLVLFILFVGGCMALIGGVANEVNDAIEEEAANDVPTAVTEGAAFSHDDYAAAEGWTVGTDGLGGATIEGLSVTNEADEARSALLTFRFYNGNENLAEVECSSNQIASGEVSAMECVSFSQTFPEGYTEIKVSDMW